MFQIFVLMSLVGGVTGDFLIGFGNYPSIGINGASGQTSAEQMEIHITNGTDTAWAKFTATPVTKIWEIHTDMQGGEYSYISSWWNYSFYSFTNPLFYSRIDFDQVCSESSPTIETWNNDVIYQGPSFDFRLQWDPYVPEVHWTRTKGWLQGATNSNDFFTMQSQVFNGHKCKTDFKMTLGEITPEPASLWFLGLGLIFAGRGIGRGRARLNLAA